jgi:hypothetical protein
VTLRAGKPSSVGDHAAENLVFIRQAMERSATLSQIPGRGGCNLVRRRPAVAARAVLSSMAGGRTAWRIAAMVGRVAGAEGQAAGSTPIHGLALLWDAPFVAGAAITYEPWGGPHHG